MYESKLTKRKILTKGLEHLAFSIRLNVLELVSQYHCHSGGYPTGVTAVHLFHGTFTSLRREDTFDYP